MKLVRDRNELDSSIPAELQIIREAVRVQSIVTARLPSLLFVVLEAMANKTMKNRKIKL